MINTLDILHSDWFIYNLREHCIPTDLYRLSYVSKYYNKYINFNDIKITIINNINKRLKQILESNYDKFMKYVSLHGVGISGSFIIQCILGEYYDGSDIDLYSYLPIDNKAFLDIFTENDLNETQQEFFKLYGDLPQITDIINTNLKNKHKLQNIYMNENTKSFDDLKKYVTESFDFNICKNIFAIVDNKPVLYVHNISHIINKCEILTQFNLTEKKKSRMEKYESRNFTFKWDCLKPVNYIRYNNRIFPYMVYKNINKNRPEWDDKITFLGLVYSRTDAGCSYNLDDGNVLLCNDINKYIGKNANRPYVANMKDIFKYVFDNKQKETSCTNCKISKLTNLSCNIDNIIGAPHICMDSEIYTGYKNRDISLLSFIIINYDDLDTNAKIEYDKLFDTKICGDNFLNCDNLKQYSWERKKLVPNPKKKNIVVDSDDDSDVIDSDESDSDEKPKKKNVVIDSDSDSDDVEIVNDNNKKLSERWKSTTDNDDVIYSDDLLESIKITLNIDYDKKPMVQIKISETITDN